MIISYTFLEKSNSLYIHAAQVDWRHSMHIANMSDWLIDRNIDYYHGSGTFYFKNERDRTMFVLKWSEAEQFQ